MFLTDKVEKMLHYKKIIQEFVRTEKDPRKLSFWQFKLAEINRAMKRADEALECVPQVRDWIAYDEDPRIEEYERDNYTPGDVEKEENYPKDPRYVYARASGGIRDVFYGCPSLKDSIIVAEETDRQDGDYRVQLKIQTSKGSILKMTLVQE